MVLGPGWLVCVAGYIVYKNIGSRHAGAEFVAKKLCPDLITVPLRFEWYSEMSSKVMSIFRQYDPNMIVAGCDEGYLKSVSSLFHEVACLQIFFGT